LLLTWRIPIYTRYLAIIFQTFLENLQIFQKPLAVEVENFSAKKDQTIVINAVWSHFLQHQKDISAVLLCFGQVQLYNKTYNKTNEMRRQYVKWSVINENSSPQLPLLPILYMSTHTTLLLWMIDARRIY